MTHRAGIIGAGGIAGLGILGMHDRNDIGKKKFDASHAGGYLTADGVELVAIADPDEEKRKTFGDAWELSTDRLYENHRVMLEAENLDVVSVCTPTLLHSDHVVDAAEIGNPSVIWCEKPIASSVADGRAMVEACAENGAELLINHSFRFTDKLMQLRELFREDELLGTIHSANAQFRMELLRNSTHLLDTLIYLLDSRADRVAGYINGENEATDALSAVRDVTDAGGGGYIVMDDGTFVTIDCTVPREDSSMMLQSVGTEGKLYLNNDDGEWRYWRLEDGEHVEQSLPGIEGAWTWAQDYQSAFPNAAEHVVELLDGTTENRSSGEEALRSLELIIGFYASHYTGGQVDVPLATPLETIEVTSW